MVKSVDAGQLTFTTDLKVAMRGGADRSHFHAAAADPRNVYRPRKACFAWLDHTSIGLPID